MDKPPAGGKAGEAKDKPPGKDIRSFFKSSGSAPAKTPAQLPAQPAKPPASSTPAPSKAADKPSPAKRSKFFSGEEAVPPASAAAAAAPAAKAPLVKKEAAPLKKEPAPVKKAAAAVKEEEDDDIIMVDDDEPPPAAKAPAAAALARPSSAAAASKPRKVARRALQSDEDDEDDDFQPAAAAAKKGWAAASPVSSDADVELVDSEEAEAAGAGKAAAGKRKRPSSAKTPAPSQKAAGAATKAAATPQTTTKVTPPLKGKAAKAAADAAAAALMTPGFQDAIAAVKKAAAALPEAKYSVVPEGANIQGNDAEAPPNVGQKPLPVGHPDCLTGLTFVVTGVLDSLWRKDAEDLVKRHGGKVTTSVSGKTSFLVAGHNCGRSKFGKASEKAVKIIDEDGLMALIVASQKAIPAAAAVRPAPVSDGSLVAAAAHIVNAAGIRAPSGGGAGPSSAAAGQPSANRQSGGVASTSGAAAGGAPRSAPAPPPHNSQLWVDKYKPSGPRELVGNIGVVETLSTWLDHWDSVHLHGQAAPTAKGASQKATKMDLSKRAVMLSGPPGIGKTSAAHIIARERGYLVVEMNASDTRNKADSKIGGGMAGKTANIIKEMVGNTTLLAAGANGKKVRQLLVMDEVDGMSGGDRGGVSDLIQTIAKSKLPIICICNDKWNQKLKSLRNHCLELEFRRPLTAQISKRMLEIATAEGLRMNQSAMEALVEGAHGDLRLILGQMQMLRLRATALTYDDVKGKMATSKDFDTSPFECARKILEPGAALLRMGDRLDLILDDFDLTPLLVQENYINYRPVIAATDAQRLRCLAKAADCISLGDLPTTTLRRTQNWSLMTSAGVIGSVMPAAYMRGSRESFNPGEMNFGRFTAWLGNNSTFNKQKRLLGDFTTTMLASGHVAADRSTIRLDYASALRRILPAALREATEATGAAAVQTTMELMQEYCINREQVDFVLDVTQFKTKAAWGVDPMKDVPTKLKSAFTRTVNKEGLVAKCSTMMPEFKKGRGKGKAKKPAGGGAGGAAGNGEGGAMVDDDGAPMGEEVPLDELEGDEGGGEGEEDEDEEDGDDTQAMQRKLGKRGITFEGKAPAAGKKGGASGSGAGRGGRGAGAAAKGAARAAPAGRGAGAGRGGRGGKAKA